MIIRPIEEKDKQCVLAMMQVFYNSPATLVKSPLEVLQKDIEDCISELPFVEGYVFEDEQNVLGYAMLAKSYSTEYGGICVWLEDLYLEPQARGKGVSKEFFSFLENKYKGIAVRIRLEVTESNTLAKKAYEKMGFSQMEYIQMSKKLN